MEVKVYMETPDAKLCFKHATYFLPDEGMPREPIHVHISKWKETFGELEFYC